MKILKFLHNLIFKTKKYTKLTIFAVQQLKIAINSKIVIRYIDYTETKADDKALEKVNAALNEALIILNLANSFSPERALIEAQKKLAKMTVLQRSGVYKSLAGEILHRSTKIDRASAIEISQDYYKTEKG